MHEVYISRLSEYIEYIERIGSYYPTGVIVNNPVINPFVYRGLSKTSFSLLPGVLRKTQDNIGEQVIINNKYLAWNDEQALLKSFIQEASGSVSIPTNDLFRWAEYAQHYGVPTRFLDWSSNPLVALFFACSSNEEDNGIVWMLHRTNYKRFLGKKMNLPENKTVKEIISDFLNGVDSFEYPLLYTPYYVDIRMGAQGSYFMVWGSRTESLEDMLCNEEDYIDLPEKDDGFRIDGEPQTTNMLFRFLIHGDRKQRLIRELDMIGINESSLFPGLDGIGRHIERQYRFNYNEGLENT